jgi:histidinol dehydrogenase
MIHEWNVTLERDLRRRSILGDLEVRNVVSEIILDVEKRGDGALLENARRFDAPDLTSIKVSKYELESARLELAQEQALQLAIDRVMRFHEAQLYYLTETMDSEEGGPSRFDDVNTLHYSWNEVDEDTESSLGQRIVPVSSAGAYVPGGLASYPSSVYMNVCPANVSMVGSVVVTTPARRDGTLPPAVLLACRWCHVGSVYKIGGAAAIAALALGTQTIEPVDKIVGPGNKFVNEAKRQLWGRVGLDGYAGSSEVCVLCGGDTNVELAAADLLTQIEHAEDNLGFLVGTDLGVLQEILEEATKQVELAPRREILAQSIAKVTVIHANSREAAIDAVNVIAPEHLSIARSDAEEIVPQIQNAGCILVGEASAESAGDYLAGPSHTLPTARAARFGSPVNVMDFLKFQSVIQMSAAEMLTLAPHIEQLAMLEGFPAHARGARLRGPDVGS